MDYPAIIRTIATVLFMYAFQVCTFYNSYWVYTDLKYFYLWRQEPKLIVDGWPYSWNNKLNLLYLQLKFLVIEGSFKWLSQYGTNSFLFYIILIYIYIYLKYVDTLIAAWTIRLSLLLYQFIKFGNIDVK